MSLCNHLGVPIALEKTEWSTEMLVFLHILLNGRDMRLGIPLEKQEKALRLLQDMEGKKKITNHKTSADRHRLS